jgi:ATP-dependent DNA helicase RecQ
MRLLRRCIVAGWVDFSGDDKPLAVLTEAGRRVMKGEAPARLLLPAGLSQPRAIHGRRRASARRRLARPGCPGRRGRRSTPPAWPCSSASAPTACSSPAATASRPTSSPSDRSLRDLALLRPSTREQLLLAHGIGPAKADKYGAELLAVIAEHLGGGSPGAHGAA